MLPALHTKICIVGKCPLTSLSEVRGQSLLQNKASNKDHMESATGVDRYDHVLHPTTMSAMLLDGCKPEICFARKCLLTSLSKVSGQSLLKNRGSYGVSS